MTFRLKSRLTLLAAPGMAAVVMLVGCSAPSGHSGPSATGTGPGSGTQGPAGFPVTVADCGRTLTFDAAPRRVVILSPIIASDMVALGLGNRIVGQSGTDYVAPPPETAKVPVLSHSKVTSTEVLLSVRPDLVISDLVYRLTPSQGGASLDELRQAGVQSYVATAGCQVTESGGTVADEFTDVQNLGKIFGVEAKAAALVAKLKGELADVQRSVAGQPKVSVFEGTLYSDQYYPVAGLGLDALGIAGGSSIFPDVANADASVSKEAITARNPQVIIDQVSGPLGGKQEQQAIAELKAAFPTTAAVKDNRIYFLGYVASGEPGSAIETVNALRQLAVYLHPAAFGR